MPVGCSPKVRWRVGARRWALGLMLAAVCWTGHAAIAEAPWPLKTPAELKALHGSTFTGAQILTYRHSVDPPQPGTAAETVIGIGKDFVFRQEGDTRVVVDLHLGRIYQGVKGRYVSFPMAADIVAWESELANRVGLAKVMAGAGAPVVFDPFWDAVELKVVMPGDPPPAIESRDDNGETVVTYNGEEALRWRPASQPLPAASAALLGHAFLWLLPVHPFLAQKLSFGGAAPGHLRVRRHVAGQSQTHDYLLTQSRWCETCDAVPGDAQPVASNGDRGGVFEAKLVPIMVAAVQGKFKSLSAEEYRRRIEAALDRGATVEAYLWWVEEALQVGPDHCPPTNASETCRVHNRLKEQMGTSADVQTLERNMKVRSIEAANSTAALREKAGANAYLIDMMSINSLPPTVFRFKTDDQEPLKSAQRQMAAVLAAIPLVPIVYGDIGKVYFAAVNPWRAWFVWEMGMANPGLSGAPNLWDFVRAIDQRARQRHPELF